MRWWRKQPVWYRASERAISEIAWLPYLLAVIVIGITGLLLWLSVTGHKTKTLLVAWIIYLFMP